MIHSRTTDRRSFMASFRRSSILSELITRKDIFFCARATRATDEKREHASFHRTFSFWPSPPHKSRYHSLSSITLFCHHTRDLLKSTHFFVLPEPRRNMKFSTAAFLATVVASASAFAPGHRERYFRSSSSSLEASTFDPSKVMPGLPPSHLLEDGGYKPAFTNKLELEEALLFVKTTLEENLKKNVNLQRVSCPMFVTKASVSVHILCTYP